MIALGSPGKPVRGNFTVYVEGSGTVFNELTV